MPKVLKCIPDARLLLPNFEGYRLSFDAPFAQPHRHPLPSSGFSQPKLSRESMVPYQEVRVRSLYNHLFPSANGRQHYYIDPTSTVYLVDEEDAVGHGGARRSELGNGEVIALLTWSMDQTPLSKPLSLFLHLFIRVAVNGACSPFFPCEQRAALMRITHHPGRCSAPFPHSPKLIL